MSTLENLSSNGVRYLNDSQPTGDPSGWGLGVDVSLDAREPAVTWSREYVARVEQNLGRATAERLGIFALPDNFRLTVIVPVFNEAATVDQVVERLRRTGLPLEMILVDDGSNDGTGERIIALAEQATDVVVIRHPHNLGKGAAIRSGLRAASGEVVVVQDADLEYNPDDLRYLLQPIVAGEADVVYGTRYGHTDRQISPWWHEQVNGLITTLANIAIGLRLSDVETCYKMVRREVVEQVAGELRENRFGIEIELTARLARSRARFAQRRIRYHHRWYDEGKKIGWRDGVSALWCIFYYGLLRR
ncbi:glycosyltransferase family 2 protein [Candidatus Laterigemmans baculatus]|uniref:glycosyltransferase family 2 protein n=1 Tax=Candidatus Laterigemmans baculatus TaxID=2770505 RepID=UPI001F33A565|nr:glycosyltransferase family 2 protein [Candidatus Laterigemmans baculatus]